MRFVAGLLFLFFGVVVFWITFTTVQHALASASWPTASGKVIGASIDEHAPDTSRGSSSGPTYSANIKYRYQVNGVVYTGNVVRAGSSGVSFGDRQSAEATLNRHPLGSDADVFYDPAHPSDAVLEQGVDATTPLLFAVGVVFLLIGIVLIGSLMVFRLRVRGPRAIHVALDVAKRPESTWAQQVTPSEVVLLNGQHFAPRTLAGNVTLLDGVTRVSSRELLQAIALAALLAHERAGTIQLEVVGRGKRSSVVAVPTGKVVDWPSPSVEARLAFQADETVRDVVHRWLAQDCSNPWIRGMEQVCVMLVLRGLAQMTRVRGQRRYVASRELAQAASDGLLSVYALLKECRRERPQLWRGLNTQIRLAAQQRMPRKREIRLGGAQDDRSPANPWNDEPVSERAAFLGAQPDSRPRTYTWKAASIVGAIAWLIFAVPLADTEPETRQVAALSVGVLLVAYLALEVWRSLRSTPTRTTDDAAITNASIPPWLTRASVELHTGSMRSVAKALYQCRTAWRHSTRAGRFKVALFTVPLLAWVFDLVWDHRSAPMVIGLLAAGAIVLGYFSLKTRASQAITRRVTLSTPSAPSARSNGVAAISRPDSTTAVEVRSPIPGGQVASPSVATLVPVTLETCTLDTLPVVSETSRTCVSNISERGPRVRRLAGRAVGVLALLSTILSVATWYVQHADPTFTFAWPKLPLLMVTLLVLVPGRKDVEGDGQANIFSLLRLAGIVVTYLRGGRALEQLHWQHEVVPIRPVLAPLLGLAWALGTLYVGLLVEAHGVLTWPTRIASVLLVSGYVFWISRQRADLERRYPLHPPLSLLALRVFGTPRIADFIELTDRWRWLGPIQQLDGPDTAGEKTSDVLHFLRGRLDQSVVADDAALQATLEAFRAEPDSQLRFPLNSMQCTDATWRAALERMLRDTDVVVMDLGGFSQSNRGCVYELGQIIEHIPLQRVMLVVDEDTDTACLVEVLGQAWSSMSEASPNSGAAPRIRAVQLRAEPAGFIEEPGSARLATSVLPADKTRFAGVLLDLAGGASATLSFTNYHWTRSGLPGPLSSL